MENFRIEEKAIDVNGKELLTKIIHLGPLEGWTTSQCAEYLGVNIKHISRLILENSLPVSSLSIWGKK